MKWRKKSTEGGEENFIYEIEELLNLMIMQFALSLHWASGWPQALFYKHILFQIRNFLKFTSFTNEHKNSKAEKWW